MIRHFTATGFIVYQGQILLHWHPKVQAWLPPGGHILPNEDPVEAVLREIEEESGLKATVVEMGKNLDIAYPQQIASPVTIMVEEINDPVAGHHKHIDLIYFCSLIKKPDSLKKGWLWVTETDIKGKTPLSLGVGNPIPPPEDVRQLALHAFASVNGQ